MGGTAAGMGGAAAGGDKKRKSTGEEGSETNGKKNKEGALSADNGFGDFGPSGDSIA
jgi:hypothetical protein